MEVRHCTTDCLDTEKVWAFFGKISAASMLRAQTVLIAHFAIV
jgi:hypothetical protein